MTRHQGAKPESADEESFYADATMTAAWSPAPTTRGPNDSEIPAARTSGEYSIAPPAPSASNAGHVGARIGQYEVIRLLGRGAMGVVYLARDNRLGRKVAIKFLQSSNEDFTRRFVIEARATAQCSHENIVVIHEVGEFLGSAFMVLEYLQGQTLASYFKKAGPLAPSRAVELLSSVVRALVCAHEQGIIHRDLKPENIFLTDSGTVKVVDFGIAKVITPDSSTAGGLASALQRNTVHGTGAAGTPLYMSPEQWSTRSGDVDHRTDLWAAGHILFEALLGYHPLSNKGLTLESLRALVLDPELAMPSAHQLLPRVPSGLAAVIDACLSKHKADRPANALSLLRSLEPFLPGRAAPSAVHLDRAPYAGLRAFQEEDADSFFGRNGDIVALAAKVRENPLMAVVGPSGVGKSSFIRAGVVPALKNSGENWSSVATRPGRDPLLGLASLLSSLSRSSASLEGDIDEQHRLAEKLRAEPGHFGAALRAAARNNHFRLLLVVDQFEELYTLCALSAERRTYTACLAAAADDPTSPVRVVLSVRSDFLGRLGDDAQFMNELQKGLFFLGPPSPEGLRDALVKPAESAGYRFEHSRMVDEMLMHLESAPAALPLLQFTAAQLWEHRDRARHLLTETSYRELGGISGALVSHADRVVAKLSPDAQRLCQALFLHLITIEHTRAVRSLDELNELLGAPNGLGQLVDHLVAARLLVQGGQSGASIEIIHESLISGWPTLRRWLDESHEDSIYLEQLAGAARQWQTKRRDPDALWRGKLAEELAQFVQRYQGEWTERSLTFANAVLAERTRSARRKRMLKWTGVVSVAALFAAISVSLVVIRAAQKRAESSAAAASRAQGDAERRLRELQAKERERLRAEVGRRAAEQNLLRANDQVKLSNEELMQRNNDLRIALQRAEELRMHAEELRVRSEREQQRAQENETLARRAEEEQHTSAKRLAELLTKERARTDRLSSRLGSPLVEELQ